MNAMTDAEKLIALLDDCSEFRDAMAEKYGLSTKPEMLLLATALFQHVVILHEFAGGPALHRAILEARLKESQGEDSDGFRVFRLGNGMEAAYAKPDRKGN